VRNVSVVHWIVLGLLAVPGMLTSGCQPAGSEEELGTIVYEVPKVPGSEKPLPMPELNPGAKSDRSDASPAVPHAMPGDGQ